MRRAGPADGLSGAGMAHVQGARDILQGRQARVLFIYVRANVHLGVGRASDISVLRIGIQMLPLGNAV